METTKTRATAPDEPAITDERNGDIQVDLVGSGESASATKCRLRAWRFAGEEMTELPGESASMRDLGAGDEVLWVDLSHFGEAEIRDLMDRFELDPAGIRAALAPWQRPSVEAFASHAFINVTVLDIELDRLEIVANEIDCFIGERFVLTAHPQELPFFDQILSRAETNSASISSEPAFLLQILLDELVNDFGVLADELDELIEGLEVKALTVNEAAFIDRLVRHKRFVYTASRLVGQHRFVLHGLLRPDFPFVSGESVKGYFAEVNDRFVTVTGLFDQARQEMQSTFDIYTSSVAHRTNGIMKTLTMISVLVLPATAVFGFFGTNFVHLPFFGTVGFIVMLLMLLALTTTQLLLFRARGWLS
jgi:magnesium transporter